MMRLISAAYLLLAAGAVLAGVGDPQLKTDHPWYPGELSCSTWERLFKTQAELYKRATGREVNTDEDKALASWYWRNLNYFHCTEGNEDIWDRGLAKGEPTREYWMGLFGYGFGLCFTTHHQWHGEMAKLLGPCRSRACGVKGHTSFEVWLTGGAYGRGRWVILDHDISTVIFTPDGSRLMGLMEVKKDWRSAVKNSNHERGWLPGGLHPSDPGTYRRFKWVGYNSGYAAVPPIVYLRAGESLRRYLKPGLEDGKTYVYWGINYLAGGIPGPHRGRTWVNQPEKMYKAARNTPSRTGQARYGNAVYIYKPDFRSGKYKEGVVDESDDHVTFEWYSPYVIAAAPPAETLNLQKRKQRWTIYNKGCTNGLVIYGEMTCAVEISTDQGKTWINAGPARNGMDLTDLVKGHHQYFIRFRAGAKELAGTRLTIRTVCQCNPTIIPHLKPGVNRITYQAGGRAYISAGPNMDQARAHVVAGSLTGSTVTFELTAPRGAKAVHLYAAAWARSGSPPRKSKYNIELSTDGGKTWKPMLKDWEIIQRKPEPGDWWTQTLPFGDAPIKPTAGPVLIRISNTGGRTYRRAEAHLVYEVPNTSPLKVTFAYIDRGKIKTASHTYRQSPPGKPDTSWSFDAGPNPQTVWVEYAAK